MHQDVLRFSYNTQLICTLVNLEELDCMSSLLMYSSFRNKQNTWYIYVLEKLVLPKAYTKKALKFPNAKKRE